MDSCDLLCPYWMFMEVFCLEESVDQIQSPQPMPHPYYSRRKDRMLLRLRSFGRPVAGLRPRDWTVGGIGLPPRLGLILLHDQHFLSLKDRMDELSRALSAAGLGRDMNIYIYIHEPSGEMFMWCWCLAVFLFCFLFCFFSSSVWLR